MTQIIWRALNGPALLLLATLGVGLQTSLFASYPLMYLQPDVVLLVVIWCALRRSFVEGGIITILGGHVAEVHSGCPQGLFMTCYMAVYLLIRASSRYVLVTRLPILVMLTLFTSIFWKLLGLGILSFLSLAENQWRHTVILLLPGAVVEGVVSIWIYRWLERFDVLTFKNNRARESLEGELELMEEGL